MITTDELEALRSRVTAAYAPRGPKGIPIAYCGLKEHPGGNEHLWLVKIGFEKMDGDVILVFDTRDDTFHRDDYLYK